MIKNFSSLNTIILLAFFSVLSFYTVFYHISSEPWIFSSGNMLENKKVEGYKELIEMYKTDTKNGFQYKHHIGIMAGNVPDFFNPWQYRVLSAQFNEVIISTYKSLGVSKPYFLGFITARLLIQTLLLFACFYYYKKFTRSTNLALLGIIALTYSISTCVWKSDLSFNTYLDILFYVCAAYVIISNKNSWLILPISILAAFNRETGILIPVALLLTRGIDIFKFQLASKKDVLISLISLAVFLFILVGIRLFYGYETYGGTLRGNDPAKLYFIRYNLFDPNTYYRVFAALSLFPILFLISWKKIDPYLLKLFTILVPIWFLVHIYMAYLNEARVLLMPLAVVFIPGVISAINNSLGENTLDDDTR